MDDKLISSMPVITIHINPRDKEVLEMAAKHNDMRLATYCRKLFSEHVRELTLVGEK
jgi:rRNA-processing protein FCF1